MARYCDPPDLGRYGVNAAAIADLATQEQVTPVIDQVSDEMDSYLRAKYTLPLASWGSDIRGCAAVMAAWEVIRVRGLRPGDDIEQHPLYIAYKGKIQWLKQIAGGTVHPEVTDGSAGATEGGSPDKPFVASNQQRGWYGEGGGSGDPFQGRRR